MNETTLLIAMLSAAVAAIGNVYSATLSYVSKRRETTVAARANDREWIGRLQDRVDALETEVAALHRENGELRELLEQHKITPPRPRLRAIASAPKVEE